MGKGMLVVTSTPDFSLRRVKYSSFWDLFGIRCHGLWKWQPSWKSRWLMEVARSGFP